MAYVSAQLSVQSPKLYPGSQGLSTSNGCKIPYGTHIIPYYLDISSHGPKSLLKTDYLG